MEQVFREAVLGASRRQDVCLAIERLYAEVQSEIDARKPVCQASGRCCRFEEFGHRLFITTLELAAFVSELQQRSSDVLSRLSRWNMVGCPFQENKLCCVHPIRPFGCRVFFCDSTSTAWQNQLYEHFHRQLKRLHDELSVPYFYVEWRQAIGQVLG
jgi:Fe-S-cluster containining protein